MSNDDLFWPSADDPAPDDAVWPTADAPDTSAPQDHTSLPPSIPPPPPPAPRAAVQRPGDLPRNGIEHVDLLPPHTPSGPGIVAKVLPFVAAGLVAIGIFTRFVNTSTTISDVGYDIAQDTVLPGITDQVEEPTPDGPVDPDAAINAGRAAAWLAAADGHPVPADVMALYEQVVVTLAEPPAPDSATELDVDLAARRSWRLYEAGFSAVGDDYWTHPLHEVLDAFSAVVLDGSLCFSDDPFGCDIANDAAHRLVRLVGDTQAPATPELSLSLAERMAQPWDDSHVIDVYVDAVEDVDPELIQLMRAARDPAVYADLPLYDTPSEQGRLGDLREELLALVHSQFDASTPLIHDLTYAHLSVVSEAALCRSIQDTYDECRYVDLERFTAYEMTDLFLKARNGEQ